MFGDIGDTRLGKGGGCCGLGWLVAGTIIGVVLMVVVVVVMAGVAAVACGGMLGLVAGLALVLIAVVTWDCPVLLTGVSALCSVLSGVRGTIPLQYNLLPKLNLL